MDPQIAQPHSKFALGSDATYLLFGLILGSYVVEAPIRYALLRMGLPMFLVNARDALAVIIVARALNSWAHGDSRYFPLMMALYVLAVHSMVGFVLISTKMQVFLGLKLFVPFLLGAVCAPLLEDRQIDVTPACLFVLLVSSCGVFLNSRTGLPWTGVEFDTPLGTVAELQKNWTAEGQPRLAGFARASYDAAMIVLVILVPLLAGGIRQLWKWLLILGVAVTIWLTTTKGALLGLLALSAWMLLQRTVKLRGFVPAYVILWAAICTLVPVFSVLFAAPGHGISPPRWLNSFFERVFSTWPIAIGTLGRYGSYVLGRGIGGVGSPQLSHEWRLYNPADNLMVYLYFCFGLAAVLYVAIVLSALRRRYAEHHVGFWLTCAAGWLVILFSFGVTTNMIEEPVMSIMAGMSFGTLFISPRTAPRPHGP